MRNMKSNEDCVDLNGKGVLAGLTNISDVCASRRSLNGEEVPCEGNLYYRGYNIKDLVKGFLDAKHPGFEEIGVSASVRRTANRAATEQILMRLLGGTTDCCRRHFVRDVIMKATEP